MDAARLAPVGVLGLRLRVPENYLSPAALLRAASVARALRSAFRFVEFLPGSTMVAVASRSPLPPPEVLIQRLRTRQLDTRLVTPAYITYLYTNDRRQELRHALSAARVPLNRDAQPVTYLYAAIGWLSKFVPALIGTDASTFGGVPAAWRAVPFALIALLFAFSRVRAAARSAALAAAAGFAGMSLESVVLLEYQAKSGALFEDLGWLVMAFMAGSALGAWGMATFRASHEPGAPRRMLTMTVLLAALSFLSLLAAWLVTSGTRLELAGATVLLLGTGTVVAAIFAVASSGLATTGEGGMGRLYAADLAGGCVGSIAASLLLIPLAGLDATAYVVAAVSLLALLAA